MKKQKVNYKNYADDRQLNLYKKFPSTHYLSNPNNVLHVMAWCTFWRRNLHRFCEDYLQIHLYWFQQITLYMMGISNLITIIASRNDSKSFMIALYACCKCILYPGTKFVIGSAKIPCILYMNTKIGILIGNCQVINWGVSMKPSNQIWVISRAVISNTVCNA